MSKGSGFGASHSRGIMSLFVAMRLDADTAISMERERRIDPAPTPPACTHTYPSLAATVTAVAPVNFLLWTSAPASSRALATST